MRMWLLSEVLQYAHFDSLLYLSSKWVPPRQEDAFFRCNRATLPTLQPCQARSVSSRCPGAVCVVRLSNVVGSDMESSNGNFIASLLSEARTGHVVLRKDLESSRIIFISMMLFEDCL